MLMIWQKNVSDKCQTHGRTESWSKLCKTLDIFEINSGIAADYGHD